LYLNVGAPGLVIPTQLGGPVVKVEAPPGPKLLDIRQGNPALAQYAVKVFGSTNLTDAQWKQCEDQLKVNIFHLLNQG